MYSYSLCDNLSLAVHNFSVGRRSKESSQYIFLKCVSRCFIHTSHVCLFQIKLDFMKMMEGDIFKGCREDTIKIGLF